MQPQNPENSFGRYKRADFEGDYRGGQTAGFHGNLPNDTLPTEVATAKPVEQIDVMTAETAAPPDEQ